MLDLNPDWDEPDIWSTPNNSPLPILTPIAPPKNQAPSPPQSSRSINPSSPPLEPPNDFLPDHSSFQLPPQPSPTTPTPTHPPSSLLNPISTSLFDPQQASSSQSLSTFSPPSASSSSWSSALDHSTLKANSPNDLFTSEPSSSFSQDDFGNLDPPTEEEEDDFGEFGDGDDGAGDDDFGGFATVPQPLPAQPVVPFRLPGPPCRDGLVPALAPALDALFSGPHTPGPRWLPDRVPLDGPAPGDGLPAMLKSDELRRAWRSLVDGTTGLARPVEWKRSQIRRLHLVHLGIPVDLNDFLAPPPLARRLLTIDTKTVGLGDSEHGLAGLPGAVPAPGHSPADRAPQLDRRRCDELLALNQARLAALDVAGLAAVRDELTTLTQQASDLLTHKLQQREQSIQDCQSYNTMISDLISAAQRIKMASPGSTKRSSSINLGSSSIASATSQSSSRWRTFGAQSPGLPQANSLPRGHSPARSVSSTSGANTPKRFSMM